MYIEQKLSRVILRDIFMQHFNWNHDFSYFIRYIVRLRSVIVTFASNTCAYNIFENAYINLIKIKLEISIVL